MGVDLKLLIVDGRLGATSGYAHTMMEFGREYDVFDELKKFARTIPGFVLSSYVARVPDGRMKGESCYGDVLETPYGDPLTFVSAGEFLKAVEPFKDVGYWGRACVQYVKALRPDTLIGLYYH